jgi:hypothetical protein
MAVPVGKWVTLIAHGRPPATLIVSTRMSSGATSTSTIVVVVLGRLKVPACPTYPATLLWGTRQAKAGPRRQLGSQYQPETCRYFRGRNLKDTLTLAR